MRLRTKLSTGLFTLTVALALAGGAMAHENPDYDNHLPPPHSGMMAPDLPPPDYKHHRHGSAGHYGHLPMHVPPPACVHGDPDVRPGCAGQALPHGYGYGYGYSGYGAPMMMVPVLRNRPCPERVVEEWVEEPVRVRRRYIAPPRHAVPEKRVRMLPDKRVPMDKRIAY